MTLPQNSTDVSLRKSNLMETYYLTTDISIPDVSVSDQVAMKIRNVENFNWAW